jgi:hypothetical protein
VLPSYLNFSATHPLNSYCAYLLTLRSSLLMSVGRQMGSLSARYVRLSRSFGSLGLAAGFSLRFNLLPRESGTTAVGVRGYPGWTAGGRIGTDW